MRPGTLARLALAGSRTDTLRVIITAASAALAAVALLAAANVLAIPELGISDDGSDGSYRQYSSTLIAEPGLRPGVVATLLLLAVPVLALAGQCIRFGAPARDRRLAALRLTGATPRQAILIAAGETATAALLGSALGTASFFALRAALHRRDEQGQLPLPTDVLPSVTSFVLVLLVVPVLAGLIGAFLLRRVIITPLGVTRRTRTRPPRFWPGPLIIAGLFAPLVITPLGRQVARVGPIDSDLILLVPFLAVLLAVVGVVVGTSYLTHTCGRVLRRFGRRPAMLLAGRQLMADPWNGSRTFAALLAALLAGAGVLAYRAYLATVLAVRAESARLAGEDGRDGSADDFYLNTMDLLNVAVAVAVVMAAAGIMVALAEGIVSRRRAYASLVATGVPRSTLGEAIAWQTLAPMVPAAAVALTVGTSMVRAIHHTVTGSRTGSCSGTQVQCADPDSPFWQYTPEVTLAVPVPLANLLTLAGGTFAAMLLVVGMGWIFLRMSTDLEELRVG